MADGSVLPTIIVSPPRTASSYLTRTLIDAGLVPLDGGGSTSIAKSTYNPSGYFEDVWLTLLNDQIIRIAYSPADSFLHITNPETNLSSDDWDRDFRYDLDAGTVETPIDYMDRIAWYTGTDWDVWGLSRMQVHGKWYKAYSRNGVESCADLKRGVNRFKDLVNAAHRVGSRLVVKDPRLVFTLPYLDVEARILLLSREPEGHLDSMRRHYGPRLFTDAPYSGYSWVSNHFNYRIGPQAFDTYLGVYQSAAELLRKSFETIELQVDNLSMREIDQLEEFLGMRIPMLRRSGRNEHE